MSATPDLGPDAPTTLDDELPVEDETPLDDEAPLDSEPPDPAGDAVWEADPADTAEQAIEVGYGDDREPHD